MPSYALYCQQLPASPDWEAYLQANSGLPGPCGNLKLARAAADLGSREQFLGWLENTPERAPENTPGCFLAFCGVQGLGRLLSEGEKDWLPRLRGFAGDPRWRVRESVAIALQRWGAVGMPALLVEMTAWAVGSLLEQRAAVAALCEPALLKQPRDASVVLDLLDTITRRLPGQRSGDDFRVLRQALGYGWSVAAAALPQKGLACLEALAELADQDSRWILRENLKKNRLIRLDPAWAAAMQARVAD